MLAYSLAMKPCCLLAIGLSALVAVGCGQIVRRPVPSPTPTPTLSTVRLVTPLPRPTSTAAALPTLVLPLATPLPTATPILYTVQAGDTLIDIARRYSVSVEALRAANGDIAPERLQIGQQLIIPPPTPIGPAGPDSLLLPTPTPLPLELAGLSVHETAVGSLWFLGEVHNPTNVAVEHVAVRVSLTDARGRELEGGLVYTALDLIPAGGRSPFGLLFPGRPAGLASFQAALVSAEPVATLGDRVPDLAVVEHSGGPLGTLYRVTGRVQNTGEVAVEEVLIVVTLYDAQGTVVGFRAQTLHLPLEPGATLPFDVRATASGGTVRYSIAAQGRRAGGG